MANSDEQRSEELYFELFEQIAATGDYLQTRTKDGRALLSEVVIGAAVGQVV